MNYEQFINSAIELNDFEDIINFEPNKLNKKGEVYTVKIPAKEVLQTPYFLPIDNMDIKNIKEYMSGGKTKLIVDDYAEIKEGDLCLIYTLTGNVLIKEITQINDKTYYLADDIGSTLINKTDIKSISLIKALLFER